MAGRGTARGCVTVVIAALCGALALATSQRSTAALAHCPASAPSGVTSSVAGATRQLVPPGAGSLVLCSYRGLNPAALAGRLEQSRTVHSAATIAQIAAELDMLPAQPAGVQCPMDDGREILALFGYPRGSSAQVQIGLTGCQVVSNGRLTRTASRPPGPALLAQLAHLV